MKSVPIRGSVGSVIADSGVDMETDPTLPRIGTDFMTHKFETAPVPIFCFGFHAAAINKKIGIRQSAILSASSA